MNKILIGIIVAGCVLILAKVVLAFRGSSSLSAAHAKTVVAAVKQAEEWENVGKNSKIPTERLVSFTRALAFLNAVRLTVSDEAIEYSVKVNVGALVKRLQSLQRSAVTAVDPKLESFSTSYVIR